MAEDQESRGSGTGQAGQAPGSGDVDLLPVERRRPRAKPKAAARTMARAEALGAVAGADGLAELVALRRSVDQLVQGLAAMLQTQEVHTEQLRALLAAATAPTDPDNRVADALSRIAGHLTDQADRFDQIQSMLSRLPEAVAAAVGAQLAAALDAVR